MAISPDEDVNTSENKDPLGKLLHEWTVTEPLPRGFESRVWRRIAQPNGRSAKSVPLWQAIAVYVGKMLDQPVRAAACTMILLVLGVVAGYWHGRLDTERTDRELQARYVQMVNPYYAAAWK